MLDIALTVASLRRSVLRSSLNLTSPILVDNTTGAAGEYMEPQPVQILLVHFRDDALYQA